MNNTDNAGNNTEINNTEELVGGIKNALERGQNLDQAKQSFINAGYSKEDIEQAVSYINKGNQTIQNQKTNQAQKPDDLQVPEANSNQQNIKPLPQQLKHKKRKSKLLILALILCIFIVLGAAALGIYWDEILGLLR